MKVAEHRKLRGFTQLQMSNMLGIKDQSTYSKKERGQQGFNIEELLLLEEILEASISELFSDKKRGLKNE